METFLSWLVALVFVGAVTFLVFRAIRMKRYPESEDVAEGTVDQEQ